MLDQHTHAESPEAVAQRLGTGSNGLGKDEVSARLARDGPNSLIEKKKRSKILLFMDQFKDFMVMILIFAAIVSIIVAVLDADNFDEFVKGYEWLDTIVIMMIVILNAVFGYVQENRAEEALEALKAMSAPTATVVRGGVVLSIPAKDLVEGDFVMLEAGNKVPADIRLTESVSMYVNEASLTGESTAVSKDAEVVLDAETQIADMSNMAFSGCLVEMGHGKGYVVATGMRTELGKIAGMIQEGERPDTPLQIKLEKLGKLIGYIVLGICVLVFIAGWLRGEADWLHMLLVAVSLAVAAIPEGLPAVVTISLALGLQRMAKKNAIIRHLPAVETLGSTQVICSDKTGTLTKGEMTVRMIWTPGASYEVTGTGFSPEGQVLAQGGKRVTLNETEALSLIGKNCLLNSNAKLTQKEGKWSVQGTATEGALVAFGAKLDGKVEGLRLDELPFDSRRKRMSTLHALDGSTVMFTKGALDFVLPLCTAVLTPDGSRPMTQLDIDEIQKANEEMAGRGLRVLSFAYRTGTQKIDERELIFVGLAGMMDPPRPEVIQAVKQCKKAGIAVVMITGDHLLTAKAVAKEIGIFDESKHKTLTGVELEKMSVKELAAVVKDVRVYARVSPEHKVKIVKAWKSQGKVVAMTGDGVNDAPALKKADIGIAMGITGTDVSKEASVMILADDNFASIVDAVEEGRGIFDNIRKFVTFLLACNVGEVLIVFFGIVVGLPLPLLALQILWMNLVTDGPPALALGVEPISRGVMSKKPRKPKESILTASEWTLIVMAAFTTFLVVTGIFFHFLPDNWREIHDSDVLSTAEKDEEFAVARTVAFMTLILAQKIFVLSMKSLDEPLYKCGLFNNKWLLLAILFGFLSCLPIIYLPFLEGAFGTTALDWHHWLWVFGGALIPFTLSEAYKVVRHALAK